MTREKAIKIIKEFINGTCLHLVDQEALETLISELKESEDERIIKTLQDYVKNRNWPLNGPTQDEVLAWLEKQKEHQPAEYIPDSVKFSEGYKTGREVGFREGVESVKPTECLKAERDGWYVCIKDYYRGGRKRSSVGDLVQAKGGMHIMGEEDISEWFRRAYYEEVGDAFKPNADTNIPEKSAEFTHHETNESLEDAVTHQMEDDGDIDDFVRKGIDDVVLKYAELGAKWQKEQKPILEVFDFKVGDVVRLKDGDGRKHIIKSFEEIEGLHGPNFYHVEFEDDSARDGIYPGEEYPNGYYTQMEKFEEEQKPAECEDCAMYLSGNCIHPNGKCENVKSKQEWSVEDEDRIRQIERIAQQAGCTQKLQEEIHNWLKSLRPSWKPSEEQMEALDIIVKYGDKESSHIKCLRELIEQLNKR